MPTENSVVIESDRERVFAVLLDPRTYPDWLVGAQSIRSVDARWPATGAKFHHRIGVGPLAVPGSTSVRRVEHGELLELGAGMGVLGEAVVTFRLRATSEGTEVTVQEEPDHGPVRVAWSIASPVMRFGLWGRNAVSLSSLRASVLRG